MDSKCLLSIDDSDQKATLMKKYIVLREIYTLWALAYMKYHLCWLDKQLIGRVKTKDYEPKYILCLVGIDC